MKAAKATLLFLVMLVGVAVAADAFAHGRHRHGGHRHGGHLHFGLHFGAPAFWYPSPYYYYPPPYYYYPRTVVVPAGPPVYVEQGQVDEPAPAQPQSGYWYYCRESNAYYPQVEQCTGPWERVPPRPPS